MTDEDGGYSRKRRVGEGGWRLWWYMRESNWATGEVGGCAMDDL